jgi:hypothetical protein
MITKNFTTGEIEQVLIDPSSPYLEVQWRNKRIAAKRDGKVQFISWQATRLPAK